MSYTSIINNGYQKRLSLCVSEKGFLFIFVTTEWKKKAHVYINSKDSNWTWDLGEIYTKLHNKGANKKKNCEEKAGIFYTAENIHRVFYEKTWLIRKSLGKISGFKRIPIKWRLTLTRPGYKYHTKRPNQSSPDRSGHLSPSEQNYNEQHWIKPVVLLGQQNLIC